MPKKTTDDKKSPEHEEEPAKQLETFGAKILGDIERKQNPSFNVTTRTRSNISYDEKEGYLRLGELKPMEEREMRLDIYNTMNADPGEYTVAITTISHYRDYGHVLNAVKKKTTLSVV